MHEGDKTEERSERRTASPGILSKGLRQRNIAMMLYIWIGLAVAFIVLEALSAQLTSVWFALGAVAALIVTVCGVESIAVQAAVFAAVSLLALLLTRPLVKRILKKKVQPTNADRSIGEKGVVTQTVDNLNGKGAVKVHGTEWTARSENGDEILPVGQEIRVTRIEGVKLIVEKI